MKLTLEDICKSTASSGKDEKIVDRSSKSKVSGSRSRKNFRRFIFVVKSKSPNSSKQGHLVSILFPNIKISELKKNKNLEPGSTRVRIHCTCPAFQYWGSAYHSTRKKYNIPGKNESRQPNIRDPKEKRLVCKHVYSVYKDIESDTFIRIYNRFKKAFYRKRDKKKKSNADSEILLYTYKFLKDQGKTHSECVSIIQLLNREDSLEDFLQSNGLLVQ